MEPNAIQCHVCFSQFSTQSHLQQHIWHYQTEITNLLARLRELFTHQSPEPTTSESLDDHAPLDDDTSPPAHVEDNEKFEPRYQEATDQCNPSDHQNRFSCPDCEAVLTRKQDLERHYTIHYQCTEFCKFCSNIFTSARKYITHKCIKVGTPNQRTYTKRTCKALGVKSKRALYAKKKKTDHATTLIKRPQSKAFGIGSGENTCRGPTTLSSDTNESVAIAEAGSHVLNRQPNDATFNCEHSFIVANGQTQVSRSLPPYPHLFSPFGVSWQAQLPDLPTPLWSTLPAGAEPTSLLPSTHVLESHLESMPGQQHLETSTNRAETQDELSRFM